MRNPQSVNAAERCLGMHQARSGYEPAAMNCIDKKRLGGGGGSLERTRSGGLCPWYLGISREGTTNPSYANPSYS